MEYEDPEDEEDPEEVEIYDDEDMDDTPAEDVVEEKVFVSFNLRKHLPYKLMIVNWHSIYSLVIFLHN
jgi:hypothetical protein